MVKKSKSSPWFKIVISLAITISISITIFHFSCPNQHVRLLLGGQNTEQTSSGNFNTNISGNGTFFINNAPSSALRPDFNNDVDAAHQKYDVLKSSSDPPWETLSAMKKAEFIHWVSSYTGPQISALNSVINNSIKNSAGGK